MKKFSEYISKRDNLLPVTLGVSAFILLVLFVFVQIWAFTTSFRPDKTQPKMQVQEVLKLKFAPAKTKTREKKVRNNVKKPVNRKKNRPKNAKVRVQRKKEPNTALDVDALLKDLNTKDRVAKPAQVKRTVAHLNAPPKSGISTEVSREANGMTNNDFKMEFQSNRASRPSGRKATYGTYAGPAVAVGSSSLGLGDVATLDGASISAEMNGRATRRSNSGRASGQISLPVESGGAEATINLNALIEWMKKHPGAIPKLVAYEMGHKKGYLSSAVSFTINRRPYTIFLSCNAVELLLRVCLVQGDGFILLKDNGIREQSNYLTIGGVVRSGAEIQSLISSRRAPGDKANEFYSIFWAWWKSVKDK